jgi:uncharacterized membrane protein YfcA
MTRDLDEQLLVSSTDEIRALERCLDDGQLMDPMLREAAELCLRSHMALASSLAAEHPRQLTSVVLARHRRRWRWRLLLVGLFAPLGLLVLALFGSAVAALVTAFIWRP